MITIQDIADRLDLSIATVSRVLNARQSHMVSEKTRLEVIKTATEMGYAPNPAARSLATGRTGVIGFWTFGVYPCFYSQIFHHVKHALSQQGLTIHITETANREIPKTRPAGIDGVLSFDSPNYTREFRKTYAHLSFPIVQMGTAVDDDLDAVEVDLTPGMTQAMEHLLTNQRSQITFVTPKETICYDEIRRRVYSHKMTERFLQPDILEIESSGPCAYREATRNQIRLDSSLHTRPTAIVAYNDEIAIGALRRIRDIGYRVPQDIMIIGCDGIEETEYHEPEIATIRFPMEEMCRKACEFLRNRIQDPSLERQYVRLGSELVVRDSARRIDE